LRGLSVAVRVGVIGVGYLGRHHARIYSELADVELAGVADLDKAAAGEIAGRYGCASYADYRELTALCDAVSIVTPTSTHRDIALDCLRGGKDILIEKPITKSLEEAGDIIEESRRRNLVLQVGHLERFNPGVVAVSEMITDPWFIECERLSPFLGRGTDVDVTLDLMIHDVDIVMSMVKSGLRDVRATGGSIATENIDVAKAWLEFENGCTAVLAASRLEQEKRRTLKVFQADSYISVDYQNQRIVCHRKKDGASPEVITPEVREPLKEELKDFVRCVKTREKPRVSGDDAVKALQTVIEISDAVRGGRRA
jgi:predicted dehydrogenase